MPIVAITVGITHDYYHDESLYVSVSFEKYGYLPQSILYLCYSCWLSVDKGVIWAFAGPVILIILVSYQFLHLFCVYTFLGSVDSVQLFLLQVNAILLLVTVISIVRVRGKATGKEKMRINTIVYVVLLLSFVYDIVGHTVIILRLHMKIWFDLRAKFGCRTAVKSIFILLPLLGMTWILGFLSLDSNTTVFAWLFTIFNSLQVRTPGNCSYICNYFIPLIILPRRGVSYSSYTLLEMIRFVMKSWILKCCYQSVCSCLMLSHLI